MTTPAQPPSSPNILALAQEAARRGDRRLAHEICARLVMDDPKNEEAWLWCAGTADSLEETIAALSQVLTLNPAHHAARQAFYDAMQHLLRQDAFLAYIAETDDFYYVRTATKLRFAQPKNRAVPEPFPPPSPPPTRTAFRWLGWSLAGLIPAGLGTLICAPFAMLAALKLLRHTPSQADRQRTWFMLWIAVALWLLALLLAALFILHF